jgi:hypothetical protein
MAKAVSNEELRLRLVEIALEVQKTGIAVDVHVGGHPRFQVASATALDPERVRICVRVGADWFRKNFTEVRFLALFDDIPFGLSNRGQLVAIFQRHPSYRPSVVDQVRAKFASNQGASTPDLNQRVSALEATVQALSARLDNQAAPLRPMPMRRRNRLPET